MIVETIETKFFGTNTYIIGCLSTRRGAIIDPSGNLKEIIAAVDRWKLKVEYILNTHAHIDHVLLNGKLKKLYGAKIAIHELDAPALTRFRWYLLPVGRARLSPPADILLRDGDVIKVGAVEIEVIHTPGHTPGSVCFRHRKKLFTGDTLMAGAIGRVSLKGDDLETLLRSIKDKLLVLSDDIAVHPGHGPRTTIEIERKYNPFLRTDEQMLKEFLKNPHKYWKQRALQRERTAGESKEPTS
ncbi:MAG TPA: MBL fold metallo-hydrolase [Proteobacteria bacterium]|nr:MBL fold metallo-hydrolase [Pseudomonadota bacterium]